MSDSEEEYEYAYSSNSEGEDHQDQQSLMDDDNDDEPPVSVYAAANKQPRHCSPVRATAIAAPTTLTSPRNSSNSSSSIIHTKRTLRSSTRIQNNNNNNNNSPSFPTTNSTYTSTTQTTTTATTTATNNNNNINHNDVDDNTEEDEYGYDDDDDEEEEYDYDDVAGGDTDEGMGMMMDWETSNPNAAPTVRHHRSSSRSSRMSITSTAETLSSISNNNTKSFKSGGIRMLDSQELVPEMQRRVQDLVEILGIDTHACTALMQEFKYSKERVLEQFTTDSEAVLKRCGVYHRVSAPIPFPPVPPCQKKSTSTANNKKKKNALAMPAQAPKSVPHRIMACPICYEDMVSPDHYRAMPCGHAFCTDCWTDFCVNAIQEGPSVVAVTCPHAGCPERVLLDAFIAALGSNDDDDTDRGTTRTTTPTSPSTTTTTTTTSAPTTNTSSSSTAIPPSRPSPSSLLDKYCQYVLRAYVDASPLIRWCPGPHCEKVACAHNAASMEAERAIAHCTQCALYFCLKCGNEPHGPVPCSQLSQWQAKCKNESETANWILANTKSCPRCLSRIEKNQGCNHMTCSKCRYEFCWICMGDWKDHGSNTGGYYRCSRFQEGSDPESDASSSQARAKRELDRYLHYYRRFHAHQEAEKFARKQLSETEARMVSLQDLTSSADDVKKWTDVEFLKTANLQLVECRRVLKYTYVFGYYMPQEDTLGKIRFEHHQEMLERFTENLSELSEKPLLEMDRTSVVNQTRVVDQFMKNMLEYVEDGMDEN